VVPRNSVPRIVFFRSKDCILVSRKRIVVYVPNQILRSNLPRQTNNSVIDFIDLRRGPPGLRQDIEYCTPPHLPKNPPGRRNPTTAREIPGSCGGVQFITNIQKPKRRPAPEVNGIHDPKKIILICSFLLPFLEAKKIPSRVPFGKSVSDRKQYFSPSFRIRFCRRDVKCCFKKRH